MSSELLLITPITKILSKFGYKDIDVCYDGNQAVEAAERTKYDLMLMDLQVCGPIARRPSKEHA